MEYKILIEFKYRKINSEFGGELVQTEPFEIGLSFTNLGDKPITGASIDSIKWCSAAGLSHYSTINKSFILDTLNPSEQKILWIEKAGTYVDGLCNISLVIKPNKIEDRIITYQMNPFTKEMDKCLNENCWTDFFYVKNRDEYTRDRTNKILFWLTIIMAVMAIIQVYLAINQNRYAKLLSIPEEINQAKAKINALTLCKENPDALDSGLYHIDGSGTVASCNEVLRLEK